MLQLHGARRIVRGVREDLHDQVGRVLLDHFLDHVRLGPLTNEDVVRGKHIELVNAEGRVHSMALHIALLEVDDQALGLFIVVADDAHAPAAVDAVRTRLHRFEFLARPLQVRMLADKQFNGFFVHLRNNQYQPLPS
jgi:folylpolyglutamate synthase/dihydropteroate synthase